MLCASCHGVLEDALILICDHNLCLGCAAGLLKMGNKNSSGYTVTCDQCGSVTDVDLDSAEQLKSQFPPAPSTLMPANGRSELNNSNNVRSPMAGVSTSTFSISPPMRGPIDERRLSNSRLRDSFPTPVPGCGQCTRDAASIRCSNCDEEFCEKCASLIHRRGRMMDHHLSPIKPVNNSLSLSRAAQSSSQLPVSLKMIRTCPVHESENVQYFCLVCENPPMCSECVMRSEEHTKHLNEVFLLKKALPMAKNRIEKLQRGLASRLGDIRQSEEEVDLVRRDLEALLETTKDTIHTSFAALRASLDRKEQELLSKADSKIRAESQRVDGVHRELQSKREKVEEVAARMEESLILNDEVATLAAYSEVKQQMSSLTSRGDSVRLSSAMRMHLVEPEAFDRALGEVRKAIEGIRGLKLSTSRIPSSSSRDTTRVDAVATRDESPPGRERASSPPEEDRNVHEPTRRYTPSSAAPRSLRPSAPAITNNSLKRHSQQDELLMSAVDDVLGEDLSPAGPAKGVPKRKTISSVYSHRASR